MHSARITLEQLEYLTQQYVKVKKGNEKTWSVFNSFLDQLMKSKCDKYTLLTEKELSLLTKNLLYLYIFDQYHKITKAGNLIKQFLDSTFGALRIEAFLAIVNIPFNNERFKMKSDGTLKSFISAYADICETGKPENFDSAFKAICYSPDICAKNTLALFLANQSFSEKDHKDICTHQEFNELFISLKRFNFEKELQVCVLYGGTAYGESKPPINSNYHYLISKNFCYAKNLTKAFNYLTDFNLLTAKNVRLVLEHANKINFLFDDSLNYLTGQPRFDEAIKLISSNYYLRFFDKATQTDAINLNIAQEEKQTGLTC